MKLVLEGSTNIGSSFVNLQTVVGFKWWSIIPSGQNSCESIYFKKFSKKKEKMSKNPDFESASCDKGQLIAYFKVFVKAKLINFYSVNSDIYKRSWNG